MKKDDTSQIGHAIREARETLGLSLSAAADKMGLSKSTLSRLETGESIISAQRLFEFADAYDVSPEELLHGRSVTVPRTVDLDRMAQVVEEVETLIFDLEVRPEPARVSRAIVEVLKLETVRMLEAKDTRFDPSRYRGLVQEIFRT